MRMHRGAAREAEVFRALADPTRRAVLERLARDEATVTELTERFGVSQPAISQHLAKLRRAGLVAERRLGRHAYYRASPAGLAPMVRWLERVRSFWNERLDRLEVLLDAMPDDANVTKEKDE